jgi:dihydrolipoamide dehydrogenase
LLKKIIILLVVAGLVVSYFTTDIGQYLTPEFFQTAYAEQPILTAIIYFVVYVVATAVSLPGAAILTLVGGLTFGVVTGVILVSFASSIGATLAFLVSRTLLQDWVQQRFASHSKSVNDGVEKDGAFYLFSLRLIPVIPFFVINLVMGLTRMRATTFYWVSQLGMFPATVVYVNAGSELGSIEEISLSGILTPGLLISFVLLAILPFIARSIVDGVKRRKVYKAYQKPKKFDTNMVVIGAGSGGLVSSYIAAAVKAKVILIEKNKMGGDCLNTGCVPSKALIRSAKVADECRKAAEFGIDVPKPKVDFKQVMARVHNVIGQVEPHDSIERYESLGVECRTGTAKILSPWQVEVNGEVINTRNIVIATGARPAVPNIEGLDSVDYLTSDSLWELNELPKRLLIIGGGPIGCELAQAFQRLGSKVTIAGRADRLMRREDVDVTNLIEQRFRNEAVEVLTGFTPIRFEQGDDGFIAHLESASETKSVPFDRVLLALGRQANTTGFGLEDLGVELARNGTVVVDDYMRTTYPNIFACGDVAGPYQFTHMAAHQAWYAAVNGLFGRFKKFKVDYSVVPWATFTDPEVARVGINELEAQQQGIDYEVTRYGIDDLDRALADGSAEGFVKVLTKKGSDKVLGATIVGYHASDLITEYITAMKHNLGMNKILGTIHIYPTVSEANKYAAGEWKRAHAPENALKWLQKFHSWNR